MCEAVEPQILGAEILFWWLLPEGDCYLIKSGILSSESTIFEINILTNAPSHVTANVNEVYIWVECFLFKTQRLWMMGSPLKPPKDPTEIQMCCQALHRPQEMPIPPASRKTKDSLAFCLDPLESYPLSSRSYFSNHTTPAFASPITTSYTVTPAHAGPSPRTLPSLGFLAALPRAWVYGARWVTAAL